MRVTIYKFLNQMLIVYHIVVKDIDKPQMDINGIY